MVGVAVKAADADYASLLYKASAFESLIALDKSNAAVQLIKSKIVIDFHRISRCYMVKYYSVLNAVNLHIKTSYIHISTPRLLPVIS